MTEPSLRSRLASQARVSLTLRARELAAGYATGNHRADRKGAGVEFAGHRQYTPGDDLRHLDRHALMHHGKLLIRECFTDTDRCHHLILDLTPSMFYGGSDGKSGKVEGKAERALLLAAALSLVAQDSADQIGLTLVTSNGERTLRPRAGKEAALRVLHALEEQDRAGLPKASSKAANKSQADSSVRTRVAWNPLIERLGALLPRGTVFLVLSDFLDSSPQFAQALGSLCTRRRTVRAVQILSEAELTFPFEGALRLRDPETGAEIETDAQSVREAYHQARSELTGVLKSAVSARGGALIVHSPSEPAGPALKFLARGLGEGTR